MTVEDKVKLLRAALERATETNSFDGLRQSIADVIKVVLDAEELAMSGCPS